jgi:hypothetical protein
MKSECQSGGSGSLHWTISHSAIGRVVRCAPMSKVLIVWRPGLVATPRDEWVAAQDLLVAMNEWIIDGDLGQFDVVQTRLRAADTVIFLDFSFSCCAHRAIRRARERIDFWWWVLSYRWQSRPVLLKAIADYAPNAELHVFRNPDSLQRFVDQLVLMA